MAAVITQAGSVATSNDNVAVTSTSFNPALNDLLVAVALVAGQSGGGTFTDTQGLGWTQVASALKNGSGDTLVVAVANALATTTSMTVTFTPAGSPTSTGICLSVLNVTTMTRTGAAAALQVTKQENQSSGTTPAPTFPSAVNTNNPTIGIVGCGGSAPTKNVSWATKISLAFNSPTTNLSGSSRASGFTGTTITWASTCGTAYCDIAIELDTSAPSSVGSSTGTGTATAVGASLAASPGTTTGTETAIGTGASLASAVSSAAGTGVAAGVSSSLAAAVGAVTGTATATGAGASVVQAPTVGSAAAPYLWLPHLSPPSPEKKRDSRRQEATDIAVALMMLEDM